jgi:hypothetical protein
MAHVRTFQTSKQHGPVSQRILTELSAAKVCLLTAESKAEYDKRLRSRLVAEGKLSSPNLAAMIAEEEACEVPEPDLPPLRTASEPRWRTNEDAASTGEPPPVPIPMSAVATPAFPAIRRAATSPGSARKYRKQSALPVVLIIGSLLGLMVLGGAALLYANRQKGNTAGQPKPKPAPASGEKSTINTAGTRNATGTKAASGSKPTPFPVGVADSSAGSGSGNLPFPVPPPAPAVETTAAKPVSQADRDELADGMRQALFRCEQALKDRKNDEFRQNFTLAEQLVANKDLPGQAKFQEQVDDLRILKQLTDEFWTAVRETVLNKLEVGEQIEFHLHKFELVSREGETVEYTLNGTQHKSPVGQMEPMAAVLVASKTIKWEDPVTFLPIAAFLSVDSKVTEESERNFGKQLFAIGKLIGKANPSIARKLGVSDSNAEIKLDENLSKLLPAGLVKPAPPQPPEPPKP